MKPMFFAVSSVLFVTACGGVLNGMAAARTHGARDSRLVQRVVDGRSLEGNLLGEEEDRKVLVYLPPGYDLDRHRRYPVVYLLSGLGGDHRNFSADGTPNRIGLMRSPRIDVGLDMKATADALIASGQIPEAVLVAVSGMNTYANHWFACSSVIGDYRSWMARDIVRFIDHHYRTRRGRSHRAILGHSSGGFGALSLAIEYPETFGAVGVLSPAGNDFEAKAPGATQPALIERFFLANPSALGTPVVTPVTTPIPAAEFAALWGSAPGGGSFVTNAVYSLSAAFSPNPERPPFFLGLPFNYAERRLAQEVFSRWIDDDLVSQVQAAPGNLSRTPVYLARGTGPTVMHPEVGDIPLLRNALIANGVVHTFEELPGDHFTVLPHALHNGLIFVLNNLGAQDDAAFTFDRAPREKHRECRRALRHNAGRSSAAHE